MPPDDEILEASSDLVTCAARLVRASRQHIHTTPAAGIRVLDLLEEHGPSGIGRLAEHDRCSQPTMSGVVATLVDRGWVAKQPSPEDARTTLVTLTDSGREALAVVRHRNATTVAEAVTAHPAIPAEDLATAVRVLREVLDRTSRTRPQEGTT